MDQHQFAWIEHQHRYRIEIGVVLVGRLIAAMKRERKLQNLVEQHLHQYKRQRHAEYQHVVPELEYTGRIETHAQRHGECTYSEDGYE